MATNDEGDFWGKGNAGGSGDTGKPGGPGQPSGWSSGPSKPTPPGSTPGGDGGFWNTPGKNPPAPSTEPTTDSGAFWTKAEDKQKRAAAAAAVPADEAKRARKRRRRKWWLIGTGSVLLLLLLLIALAPNIAGSLAPGIIQSQAGKQINGQVKVESASFSWFGPQRVQKMRLMDKEGKEVATLSVEAEAGLTGLIVGNLDLGTVTLSNVKADIIKYEDGTTNLQRAITPRKPKPPEPESKEVRLPDSLHAKVTARRMQVSFTDLSRPGASATTPTVTLRDADLSAEVGAGRPLTAAFNADALSGSQSGHIDAKVKSESLIRKDGLVQPAKASIDAEVRVQGLPLDLADALITMPQGVSVRTALGDTLDLTFTAKGDLASAVTQLTATASNLSAHADLKVADGVLTTQSPLELTIKGPAINALVPQVGQAMQAQSAATIESFPDVRLAVDGLRLILPVNGPLNLRGAGADITLNISETRGSVALTGSPAQTFTIAPLQARVQAPDLAKAAHIVASTTASIGGRPAGEINVDLTLADVLDPAGAPRAGLPGTIEGTVAIRRIATAIAQPFLQGTGLDLPRDIGPTLDVELRATADSRGTTSGGTPPTNVAITVTSEGVRVNGALALTDTAIKTSGEGIRVEMPNLAQVAGRFVDESTGYRVSPAQPAAAAGAARGLTITLKDLDLPRDAATGAMQMDKAAGRLSATIAGLAVAAVGPGVPASAPINIESLALGAQLTPGGDARIDLTSAMQYATQRFSAVANFAVPKVIVMTAGQATPAPVAQLRPVGKLELRDVPTALAKLFLKPTPAEGDAKPLDLAQLVSDTLGQTMSVTVTTAATPGVADAMNATVAAQSSTTTATVQASVSLSQIALQKLNAQINVTPQMVSGLSQAFAPNVAGMPRLVGPSKVMLVVDPVTIPMQDNQPQLARAGVFAARLSIPGRTLVEGLQVTNEDGTKRDLGRVGVDSLEVAASVPLGALMGPVLPEQRNVTARLSGTVVGGQEDSLMVLSGQLSTQVSDGKLAGALAAEASLSKINTRLLEKLAGKDGLISGAIGDTLSMQLTANLAPPPASPATDGVPAPFDPLQATTQIQLTLAAPRLRTNGPLKATIAPGGLTLTDPVTIGMDVEPAWANTFLEKQAPAGSPANAPKPPPDIQLTQPIALTINLSRLTYPMGDQDPAHPKIMEAVVAIAIPDVRMRTSEGQAVRMTQANLIISAVPVTTPGAAPSVMPEVPVEIKLDVAEATLGDQPSAQAMILRGTISGLVDARGTIDTKTATVTLNGDLPLIPSALIDAAAKQEGLIVDALGPVASVKVQVERFPLGDVKSGGQPPIVSAQADSPRARARLRGTIRDNVFVSELPLEVTVMELTDELAKRFIKGLPLMGTIQKSNKEAPALVTGANLTVPLGNDMTKLNGEFRIDPGEARFEASSTFSGLLRRSGQREAGLVGKRLDPINVRIVQGVATYERWTLPLGEFEVQTQGTVDLVKRTIDVVTYVPFGELSDSAAGLLNTSLNSVLGKLGGTLVNAAAIVPIRTQGPLDNPSTNIDAAAFAENLRNSIKPEDLIKKGLGDLLKKQGK